MYRLRRSRSLRLGVAPLLRRRFVAEAHLSTACSPAPQEARFPRANENEEWPQSTGAASRQGAARANTRLAFPVDQEKSFAELPAKQNLPREWRLLRRSEYDAVYREGRRRSSAAFVIFSRRNSLPRDRFGMSVKKALGNAVVRNRIRRRVREILRLHREEIARGWDVVIHPSRAVATIEFAKLEVELLSLLPRPKRESA